MFLGREGSGTESRGEKERLSEAKEEARGCGCPNKWKYPECQRESEQLEDGIQREPDEPERNQRERQNDDEGRKRSK